MYIYTSFVPASIFTAKEAQLADSLLANDNAPVDANPVLHLLPQHANLSGYHSGLEGLVQE